jgi:hypothetical protein
MVDTAVSCACFNFVIFKNPCETQGPLNGKGELNSELQRVNDKELEFGGLAHLNFWITPWL